MGDRAMRRGALPWLVLAAPLLICCVAVLHRLSAAYSAVERTRTQLTMQAVRPPTVPPPRRPSPTAAACRPAPSPPPCSSELGTPPQLEFERVLEVDRQCHAEKEALARRMALATVELENEAAANAEGLRGLEEHGASCRLKLGTATADIKYLEARIKTMRLAVIAEQTERLGSLSLTDALVLLTRNPRELYEGSSDEDLRNTVGAAPCGGSGGLADAAPTVARRAREALAQEGAGGAAGADHRGAD